MIPGLVQKDTRESRREEPRAAYLQRVHEQRRWRAYRDREQAKLTLERLRYRQYQRHGTLGHILGTIRQRWVPWAGWVVTMYALMRLL